RIRSEDFYRRDHGLIYDAIQGLANSSKPYDIVTVAEWLDSNEKLDDIGGMGYLAQLAENTPSAANISSYADIVRQRSILRDLISAGAKITESAFRTEGRTSDELLDTAESLVFSIAERESRSRKGFQPVSDLISSAIDRIDELFKKDNPITGVSTGFYDLDTLTSGLQKSDLVIIAGRPSMGKTAFALNIAQHAALKDALPVAVFSMEMPGEQLVTRMLSSLGRIDQSKLRIGKLGDDDWPRLASACAMLNDAKIFIDDTPALSPGDLRARCRRLAREQKGLGLVVIDYLQLMQVSGTKENRATEISEISRSLKALAKELEAPVVALSQLNRSLEQRTDKRPVMSDLRESGAIEQDADVIMFIYRDEVYDDESVDKGLAEIIISKQRNGPIGMRKLRFLGQYTLFENLAHGGYEANE
ncbi:MAG: replicative DNA helicase, partial [Gammaproteobacteria bacterium]|nr:replicative DNA helicase [Gammaproteobacteria bacterium]